TTGAASQRSSPGFRSIPIAAHRRTCSRRAKESEGPTLQTCLALTVPPVLPAHEAQAGETSEERRCRCRLGRGGGGRERGLEIDRAGRALATGRGTVSGAQVAGPDPKGRGGQVADGT